MSYSLYHLHHWQVAGNISLLDTIKLDNTEPIALCYYYKKNIQMMKRWLNKTICCISPKTADGTHDRKMFVVRQSPVRATWVTVTILHIQRNLCVLGMRVGVICKTCLSVLKARHLYVTRTKGFHFCWCNTDVKKENRSGKIKTLLKYSNRKKKITKDLLFGRVLIPQ